LLLRLAEFGLIQVKPKIVTKGLDFRSKRPAFYRTLGAGKTEKRLFVTDVRDYEIDASCVGILC